MSGFFKVTREVVLQVTDMCKVNSSLEGTDHSRQIIIGIGSVGTGAEGHAIMRIVYHAHHALQIWQVNDDARKTEHTPGRIIRVDGHVNVIFVTYRHDCFEEVL